MSLAADTRQAVDDRPFLHLALRAGVLNYTAAARYLELDGDEEAIATALRRYRKELPPLETDTIVGPVSMRSGLGTGVDLDRSLLTVGDVAIGEIDGESTGLVVSGAVDAMALASAIGALEAAAIEVSAAGLAGDTIVIVVDRDDGRTAVRILERVLDLVPR